VTQVAAVPKRWWPLRWRPKQGLSGKEGFSLVPILSSRKNAAGIGTALTSAFVLIQIVVEENAEYIFQ
jgi:hypothetical protein